jgi:tRNA(Ile)-lysidine synthase
MSTLKRVLQHIETTLPLQKWLPFRLLVAVSGGADSVALLRLLKLLKDQHAGKFKEQHAGKPIDQHAGKPVSDLIVAHVNHGLRGDRSDQEQAMVLDLARSLKLECHTTKLQVARDSSEEQLREQRYRFLVELAHQQGARLIATGHHADDQAETILFRICRGTGVSGLAGMSPISPLDEGVSLIRPLLGVWRYELEGLLTELGQAYCDDPSNLETTHTRNFLRQEIMPSLADRFGRSFPANLCRLGCQARELEEFLNEQTRKYNSLLQYRTVDRVQIDCRGLQSQPHVLVRHFLKLVWTQQGWPQKEMTFEKWQQLSLLAFQVNAAGMTLPGRIQCSVSDAIMTLMIAG